MSDITYEHIKAIAKLENDVKDLDATIKQLKGDIDHNVKRALEIAEEKDATIKQLKEEIEGYKILSREFNKTKDSKLLVEIERDKLKESLKTCIDELIYTSSTGRLWMMWAKSNEAVPERLLEIRKLVYP